MAALKKKKAAAAKKIHPKTKKVVTKTRVVYVKVKEEESGMHDLTHVAMDGVVLAGTIGLMGAMMRR